MIAKQTCTSRIELEELLDSGKNRIKARIKPRTFTPKGERFTNCATVTFLYFGGEGDRPNIPAADSPLPPWGPIHKVHTGGRAGPGPGRAGSQWALESPGPKNSFGWAHVNKITYARVFYTAPCVKCLMRASALLGVGP